MDKEREAQMKRNHYAKYEEIAQKLGVSAVARNVPASPAEIAVALKTDEHLNNIPLHLWDAKDGYIRSLAAMAGYRSWSLSETVCVLKHVARHHIAKVPAPE